MEVRGGMPKSLAIQKAKLRKRRELRRQWLGNRIDWRKLIFFVAIMTTAAAVLQIIILPYPVWFLVPPATISSYEASNNTTSVQSNLPVERVELFQPVGVSSLTNTTKAVEEGKPRASRRRRRRRRVKTKQKPEEPIFPPPPPRVVTAWQVEVHMFGPFHLMYGGFVQY
ncbi:uncharacterized protein LOC113302462 isoform X2 [Papaver somniferum]|uniref:uncharacterized protein LOC113302462 isoform X2 n=1 Tax=Papaver somniferum TaxID=3469 RepID=UPI000E7041B9|nr:uncharacterized protein LOC113302462 isoform X2 [Papaver somniferum]